MTPPLVVVERHRNRKSVPDCDAIQINAKRCKNLTCFDLRGTTAAPPYRSDALAYRSGSGRVRGTVSSRPNASESRDVYAPLIRAFQSRTRPNMSAGLSRSIVVRALGPHAYAQKSPRPRSGAQYQVQAYR